MALYLTREKLATAQSGGTKVATGTVISDNEGRVTFPKLDFTPKFIAVWNIKEIDEREDAEEDGEEWPDDYEILYRYEGIMLFAFYDGKQWMSQIARSSSSTAYISNSSYGVPNGYNPPYGAIAVSVNDKGQYQYQLYNGNLFYQPDQDFVNTEFNYAIYG